MNSEKNIAITPNEEKILAILADLANSLEKAAINIKHQIAELVEVDEEPIWDPNNVKWEQVEGASGPYERSEDINSLDFKAMLKDLAAHQGKLSREGFFYWTFKNGATVGRKKRNQ